MIRTLLCVGFDHLATECIERELEADGFVIIGTSSIPNAVKLIARPVPDNTLLNTVPTGIDMKATVRQLGKAFPATKIVAVIKASGGSSGAKIDCLSTGAHARSAIRSGALNC